jgi:hypothetical protein
MRPAFLAAVALGLVFVSPVLAQKYERCGNDFDFRRRPETFRQRIADAQLVTVLTAARCFPSANGDDRFITEFTIDQVVKPHPAFGKQKVMQLPFGNTIDPKKPLRMLVFFVAKDGELIPYSKIMIDSPKLLTYVSRARRLDPKDTPAQLQFFFAHLENADPEIAEDAWLELHYADQKELIKAAASFSRVRLRAYLKSDEVPIARKRLYVMLLGVCGIDADANLLRSMLDAKDRSIREEILTSYVQLRPKEGWERLRDILQNEKNFMARYQALRVARYLHDDRPDLISKKDALAGMCLLLPQFDIADLVIEDLRERQYWEAATDVLNLDHLESHASERVVRRAILRYAVAAQHLPAAKAFVEEKRRKDPVLVDEMLELLKLEKDAKEKP